MINTSVIVPVYNEEATILQVLRAIDAQTLEDVELEVIVVDDGSSDRTPDILAKHSDLYAELITLPRNGGKGAAVKAGLRVASGDYILFQDADLEYDPQDYARLFYPIIRFSADLVMGSRLSAPHFTRVHFFWHKVGNRLITLIFNILYNTTFTDIYSCYLVYRRVLLDPNELRADGWEQQAEILTSLVFKAKQMYEVPIGYRGRSYEEGKKIRAYHTVPIIWTIIKRRFLR